MNISSSEFFLSLAHNQLMSLSQNVLSSGFEVFQMITIDLNGNPLECDSDLCWLKLGVEKGSVQFPPQSEPNYENNLSSIRNIQC